MSRDTMSSSTQPPDGGSSSHSAADRGSSSDSAPDLGRPPHSALSRGNPYHSNLGRGSPHHLALGRGNPPYSVLGRGNPPYSALGRGNPPYSLLGRGSLPYSALGRGSPYEPPPPDRGSTYQPSLGRRSPFQPALDRGSPPHSAPDWDSPSHEAADRGSPDHSGSDSDTPSYLGLGPGSPIDTTSAERPAFSPLHWGTLVVNEGRLSLEPESPSILERASPTNNDDQVPESSHQQRRAWTPEYSDAYTANDILYQMRFDIENQLALDPRGRLDLMIRNTLTRFGDIVERGMRGPSLPHNEDSNSVEITSASEESNQSLPEAQAQPEKPALPETDTDKTEEPPAKLMKVNSPKRNEEVDGETCPICLDTWGNSGKHRLVALRCGHLFGAECVERWLKAQPQRERSCPTCKTKAGLKDLRFIYARRLIAADTTEITKLQQQVETLQAEKSRTEIDLQSSKMTQRMYAAQVVELKEMLAKSQMNKGNVDRKTWRFALEKNLEMCKEGGCRVLAYNCRTYELYVSQKSVNYLFPGYGIRKVSCVDYTLGQFVYLHPKPIRDIMYSQPTDLLLSVGLDSTAKIVERGIPNVTVNAGFPLWSCSWDRHNTNEFYVGGVGGVIHHYDYRNLSATLRILSGTGDMSPVVSVCSTNHGLLSCQLNSCWLWETKTGEWVPKTFPVNGTFMSMCYDNDSNKALLSTRPKGSERSKLTVCTVLPYIRGGADINVDYMINGSSRTSVMSRATFCKTPTASWVAAHSESDATLHLHGLNGARSMSLPAAEPALDVCSLEVNGVNLLTALSDSRLRIYKAVQTSA